MNPQPGSLVPVVLTPQLLSRLYRHEIGNFLQIVYSSSAILKRRLPADAGPLLDLTGDLRTQADACRLLLDTVHDFLAQSALHCESVNLGELAKGIATRAAARNSHLAIRAHVEPTPSVWADAQRLGQAGNLLVNRACEAARHTVEFRSTVHSDTGTAVWEVWDDGPGVPADEWELLVSSLLLLRDQRLVQGLAPVQQIVALHGGQLQRDQLAEARFCVRIVLPVAPRPEQLTSTPM